MFFPIAVGDGRLQKVPWISFFLGGVTFACFVFLRHQPLHFYTPEWRNAWAFYTAHPDLVLPELMVDMVLELEDFLPSDLVHIAKVSRGQVPNASVAQMQLNAMASAIFQKYKQNLMRRLGLYKKRSFPLALLTYPWIHRHQADLAMGLLTFLLFAPLVENMMLRRYFLVFLLGIVLAVGVLQLIVGFTGSKPLTGMVGLGSAMMGYFLWFNRKKTVTIFLLYRTLGQRQTAQLPAEISVTMWTLLLVLLPIPLRILGFSRQDSFSPVIGLGLGLFYGWLVQKAGWVYQVRGYELPPAEAEDRVVDHVASLLKLGESGKALEKLAAASDRYPENEMIRMAYWNQAVRMHLAQNAVPTGLWLMERQVEKCQFDLAFFTFLELQDHEWPQPCHALRLKLINGLLDMGESQDAARVLAWYGRHLDGLPLENFIPLANSAGIADPQVGTKMVALLLQCSQLDDQRKAQLTKLGVRFQHRMTDPGYIGNKLDIELAEDVPVPGAGEIKTQKPTIIDSFAILEVVPLKIATELAFFRDGKGRENQLRLNSVKAIAAGKINNGGACAFVVVDLWLDHPMEQKPKHRALRLRADQFDIKGLFPDAPSGMVAYQTLIDRFSVGSQPLFLPDEQAVRGRPFNSYSSLTSFREQIYGH